MLDNSPLLATTNGTSRNTAVLLLHGLGGGPFELSLLARALLDQGFPVSCPIYPGHAGPGWKMPDSTWEQWYDSALQSYKELANNFEAVHVVGFSTGGTLALHLSTEAPIERMVLLSPFLRIKKFLGFPLESLVTKLKLLGNIPRKGPPIKDPDLRSRASKLREYRTFNLQAVRSALSLINLVEPKLSNIETPTLIVQSQKDSVVDPSGAALIYDSLASQEREIQWLQNSDHGIALDLERARVFSWVLEFLDKEEK